MLSKKEQAIKVRRNLYRTLERLRIKARHGDKEACWKIIPTLTELNVKLKKLGYRIDDDNRLVLITKKWIEEQKAKMTEMDKFAKSARSGDPVAVREFILKMAEGY